MNKTLIFITIVCYSSFISAVRNSIGISEENQVLVWVDHRLSEHHPESTNIAHVFDFDGTDRNVGNITFVTYDYDLVRIFSSFFHFFYKSTYKNFKYF